MLTQSPLPRPTPNTTTFNDVTLLVQEGDKRKDIDSFLLFQPEALAVQPKDKKQAQPLRTLAYADVKSAEYSFGKSPRVSAALLVSPGLPL